MCMYTVVSLLNAMDCSLPGSSVHGILSDIKVYFIHNHVSWTVFEDDIRPHFADNE